MRLVFFFAAFLVAGTFSQRVRNTAARRVQASGNNIVKSSIGADEDFSKRVVCYYTNWSVYRKGMAKYQPGNINPYLCTHLVYAFGGLTDEFEVTPFDSYQDIEQGGYGKFNGLKQYNKGMKTLLAIGGWNEGSSRFSELVSRPEYRQNFTQSVIRHCRRYKFDGLDLDWEYPASRKGSVPEDKENYAILVKELREAFHKESHRIKKRRLLLTMAVPAGQSTIDKGYDIPKLNQYLDFFNLLTYDYHSVYEPSVNHHAALLPPPGISEFEWNAQLNIDWTIKYYLSKGASASKLVMGIPTYGRAYTLLDGKFTDFGSSADGPGAKGKYTNEKGYLAFYEICENIAVDHWLVKKPFPKRVGPIATKLNQWVGYDDEKIVAAKADYVNEHELGGIMFWTLDSDDFRGVCNGEKYPLIEAAKRALFKRSPTAENEARALSDPAKENRLNSVLNNDKKSAGRRRQRPGQRTTVAPIIHPENTPEPPTTPSSIKGFNCKRTGFYPNPDNCNKYYWCLDSGPSKLGIVAHAFSCPSDLRFNKQIDGCDQPSNVKCKTTSNRGGVAAVEPTTTPFPRTTPFDETLVPEYDQYTYDEYYYYDEPAVVDETIGTAPETENTITQNTGGGSQFQNSRGGSAVQRLEPEPVIVEESPSGSLGGGRTRPQYTTIERERPQQPTVDVLIDYDDYEQLIDEVLQQEQEQPIANRPNRPQYTTLNRQRPSSSSDVNVDETLVEGQIETATEREGLNYVTIQRQRPALTEGPGAIADVTPSSADDNLEYVTLNRARPSSTTEIPAELLDYYDEIFNEEPLTTTTTTEPTTTIPVRIRIPTRRPKPIRPPASLSVRNRFRGRQTTTTTTTEVSIVESEVSSASPIVSVTTEQQSRRTFFPIASVTTEKSQSRRTLFNRRKQSNRSRVPSRTRLRPSRPRLPVEDVEKPVPIAVKAEEPEVVTEAVEVVTESPVEETLQLFEEITPIVEEVLAPEAEVEIKEIPVEAAKNESDTSLADLFNFFKPEDETTTRKQAVEEEITSSKPIIEVIPEEKVEAESTTIPFEVEDKSTIAPPRNRRPNPFRSHPRPRPIGRVPIEEKPIVDQSEGRDISAPSFTSILSGVVRPSHPDRRPSLQITPVTEITEPVSTTRTTTTQVPETTTIRRIPVVTSARPQLTTPRRNQSRRPTASRPVKTTPAPRDNLPVEYEYVYDYYEDPASGALGGTLGELASLTEKAIILPDGTVQCYDTGYFPHPESCKKFVSCSKTVRGFLRGWTYTCPQELVFDPVGGMCNWTEAVDCIPQLF